MNPTSRRDWAETASNCAAGKVVTQFALSLARQSQLMGGDCIEFLDIPFCAMFGNCLNEIEECCNAGDRGSAKVAEVLGLERQDQLVGAGCIDQNRAQEVIDECSSNVWTGSFSLTANGYRIPPQRRLREPAFESIATKAHSRDQ